MPPAPPTDSLPVSRNWTFSIGAKNQSDLVKGIREGGIRIKTSAGNGGTKNLGTVERVSFRVIKPDNEADSDHTLSSH